MHIPVHIVEKKSKSLNERAVKRTKPETPVDKDSFLRLQCGCTVCKCITAVPPQLIMPKDIVSNGSGGNPSGYNCESLDNFPNRFFGFVNKSLKIRLL